MIKVNNIKKHYQGFDLDVSIDIPEGRVSGIVGRNGAGKSTLLKLILGLNKPDSGSVMTLGKNAFDLSAADREKIGVSLAEAGFSQLLDIKSIINILKKMYKDFDEDLFLKKVKDAGLPLDKDISGFSTGMKAKLRVLVALCHKADVLVLDEPTSGLDVIARNEVIAVLREYMAEDDRRSLLISSHISSDLEGLCDDIYLIDNGKIVFHEDTDVLIDSYAVLKMNEEVYEKVNRDYFVVTKKTSYGYDVLTNQKQYYAENYPGLVIENGNIDEIIMLMSGK